MMRRTSFGQPRRSRHALLVTAVAAVVLGACSAAFDSPAGRALPSGARDIVGSAP